MVQTGNNYMECIIRLQAVEVSIISNADCKAKNRLYNTKVLGTMLCAGVPEGGKVD